MERNHSRGLGEDIGAAMLIPSFFSSRDLAEAYLREMQQEAKSVEEMAAFVRGAFADALHDFAHMSRSLYEAAMVPPEPARSIKVQRNAECPCGSGKKDKKCCGVRH